ncbi:MAG: DNA-binding protein HU [Elusimicrobia bacterium RIFOXYB2_FULL_49_7]|nr:MAG: DNA-binding protein HU [Elusimicrobia bacterium RIFOXYB2_FULL_49_7]
MNKAQLVASVAKDLKSSKAQAEHAVNSVLDNIRRNTKKGVQLIGFGSFSVSNRKARKGRNPQTGATITIKASRVVRFRAGSAYKKSV